MPIRDDFNLLIDAALPFAEQMLRAHGEFLPFGAQMLLGGEITLVSVDDGDDAPASQSLIDAVQAAFKARAAQGQIVATAVIYDVKVVPPGASDKTDAIALNLDHRENRPVTVFFPYALGDEGPNIGDAFANAGKYAIFPSATPFHA